MFETSNERLQSWAVRLGDKFHDLAQAFAYNLSYPLFSIIRGVVLGIADSWIDAE